jgi:hypothetical protein
MLVLCCAKINSLNVFFFSLLSLLSTMMMTTIIKWGGKKTVVVAIAKIFKRCIDLLTLLFTFFVCASSLALALSIAIAEVLM